MRVGSFHLFSTAIGVAALLGGCASAATTTSAGSATAAATVTTAGGAASTASNTVSPAASAVPVPAVTGAPTATATTAGAEVAVAGDIPDSQSFVAYRPPAGGWTIKVPEGWARSTDGAATVFSDKFNTIRVETVPMTSAPTAASVTASDVPAIAQSTKGYVAGKVSVVTRKAGQAILATYALNGAPNAVTNKVVRLDAERYEFWRNGTAVVITLSSAAGSDNVDPWKTVTDGFGWVG